MDAKSTIFLTYVYFIVEIFVLHTVQKTDGAIQFFPFVYTSSSSFYLLYKTVVDAIGDVAFICCAILRMFYTRSFRFKKHFLYIHCTNRCTIYSVILGLTVPLDSLLFCATGKQAFDRDGSSPQSMSYQGTYCN